MSNFIQVTPFMIIEDLDRAVKFFTDILGFKTILRFSDYAYVHRKPSASGFGSRPARTRRRPGLAASRITLTFAT